MPDVLHQHWPDAWFAARLLPPARRRDLGTLFATMLQMEHVVGEPCSSGGSCEGGGSACTGCCHSTSEKSTCGDENTSLGVVRAMLDHLWRGEPTGQADLDAFHGVVQSHDLPRVWFEQAIEAMSQPRPPRVATWNRLRQQIEAVVSPCLAIVMRVLELGEPTAQAVALGVAMRLTRLLERVRQDAGQGRVVLPLDDLVKCSLSDADLLRLAPGPLDGPDAPHAPDDRFAALVRLQAQRIAALLDGGAKAIRTVPAGRRRKAVAVLIELERRRLDRCVAALLTNQPLKPASLRQRLGALRRALGAAAKG